MKHTTYECGFRLDMEEGTQPITLSAPTPEKAAEKFADYAHARLGMWEYGDVWEGEKSIGVRPLGRETFYYFTIERRIVPEFTARAERA